MKSRNALLLVVFCLLSASSMQIFALDPWTACGLHVHNGYDGRHKEWLGRDPYFLMNTWANTRGRTGTTWDQLTIVDSNKIEFMKSPVGREYVESGRYGLYLAIVSRNPMDIPWSMEAMARGDFNEYYKKVAETLVEAGAGNIVINFMHEAHGSWTPWAFELTTPQTWTGAWRQVVTTFRSVPGANFKFLWTNGCQLSKLLLSQLNNDLSRIEEFYPGDDYVDLVGIDMYDVGPGIYPWEEDWVPLSLAEKMEKWEIAVNDQIYGREGGFTELPCSWWADLCRKHNKQLAFMECGCWNRGNLGGYGCDNPYWIETFYKWMKENSDILAWHAYFQQNPTSGWHGLGPYQDSLQKFPEASEAYYRLYNADANPASLLPRFSTARAPAKGETMKPGTVYLLNGRAADFTDFMRPSESGKFVLRLAGQRTAAGMRIVPVGRSEN